MARQIQRFSVTIPAGTPENAGWSYELPIPQSVVGTVEIIVPPGPHGQVGFALGSGGMQTIPAGRGNYVVADNDVIRWPLNGQIDSGAWQLLGYNIGTYNHTLQIIFLTDPIPETTVTPASTPLAASSISSPPSPVALPALPPPPVI